MFEIFSLGDTQTFAEVLNGVAMMFSNSPILKGNGPLQLGFGAFLGAIILFLIMIYKAVFENRFELKTLLIPLALYMVLTVPKTTVVISDVYNVENPKVVDNIPIGLAVPASVISGIATLMTQYIEKAFMVLPTDNSETAPTQLTQDGFLTPLQVLNAIRYDNLNTDHPLLQGAFNQIYARCIVGNPLWNPEEYTRSKDAAAYFQTVLNSTERLVSFTVSQAGQGNVVSLTCSDAGSYVAKAMEVHVKGENADPTGLLGSNFKKNSMSEKIARAMAVHNSFGKNKGIGGTIKYSDADIAKMVSSVTGMSTSDSRSFMMNVLFDPMVKTASKCTDDFNLDQISKCAAWVSTIEQWKDRSAASGTSFLKKMKDGQNVMVLVGFMLFPFMVFMIMLQGMGSKRLVGGYVAFMLSNYLWLPMAAIINFYGQYQFQEAVYLLKLTNPEGLFTINQAPQLYDVITTRLAVANNAMGMVPIFCSMLFGGMMWGVSSFSKAINPSDGGYDAQLNSKTIQGSGPLNSHSSMTHKDGFGATTIQGVGSTDMKTMNTISAARSRSSEYDDQINKKVARLEQLSARTSDSIGNSVANSQGHRNSTEIGTQVAATYNDGNGATNKKVLDGGTHSENNVNDSDTLSVKNEKSGNTTAKGDVTLAANVRSGFIEKAKAKLVAGVSVGVDSNVVNASTVKADRGVINSLTEKPTFDNTKIDESGIRGGEFKTKEGVTTENIIAKIKNSKDANFKATALNEIIQQDNSNTFTAAEKREAAQLTSEVRSLSNQKSETLQWVLSNTITDSDVSGRTNVLAPNSKVFNAALDNIDQLGQDNVQNWDQLKQSAAHQLRLGGNSIPETIERVSIYMAARHSHNSEVMHAALDAVAPTTTVVDNFRERGTFSNLESIDSRMAKQNPHFKEVSASIDVDTIAKAKERFGTSITEADDLIQKTGDLVKKSTDLSGKEFEPVKQINVNQIAIDKQQKLDVINKEYGDVSANIASNAPVIVDASGKLITPTITPYKANPTEYDRQLTQAQKDGDNAAVIKLLNEKQLLKKGENASVDEATKEFEKKIGQ